MPAASLDLVEEKIIQYVNDNPGCSKSDVVRFITNRQIASRITVLIYLDKLENRKIISYELEKPNSQIYRIYANKDSELVSIIAELEEFKEAYVSLLEKSKEMINTKDYSADARELGLSEIDPSKWSDDDKIRYFEFGRARMRESAERMRNTKKQNEFTTLNAEDVYLLIFYPILLFYMAVDLVFFRSMMVWPYLERTKKDSPSGSTNINTEMYLIAYKKITEMQLELSRFIESIMIIKNFTHIAGGPLVRYRYGELGKIRAYIGYYRRLNMGLEIQRIAYQLVKLNKGLENLKLFGLDTMSLTSPSSTSSPTS